MFYSLSNVYCIFLSFVFIFNQQLRGEGSSSFQAKNKPKKKKPLKKNKVKSSISPQISSIAMEMTDY